MSGVYELSVDGVSGFNLRKAQYNDGSLAVILQNHTGQRVAVLTVQHIPTSGGLAVNQALFNLSENLEVIALMENDGLVLFDENDDGIECDTPDGLLVCKMGTVTASYGAADMLYLTPDDEESLTVFPEEEDSDDVWGVFEDDY